MAIIATDLLESGMVLKSEVTDRSGRLLLPAGAELTDKHLNIFRTWGISGADVEREGEEEVVAPVATSDDVDPERLAEAQRVVASFFIHNDSQNPFIQELMRICALRQVNSGA
ncbi:MAG TPA: hypothetical protein HPP76_04105 [Desulfuromonadales bacterium]|nr:hypothetical protein [Desulfuromonadales bacterium]